MNTTFYDFTDQIVNAYAQTDLLLKNQTAVTEGVLGVLVGNFKTKDLDTRDSHTYSFVSGTGSDDNAKFTIDEENGNLKTAVALDYSQKQKYVIRVRTTDSGNMDYEKNFTIIAKKKTKPQLLLF